MSSPDFPANERNKLIALHIGLMIVYAVFAWRYFSIIHADSFKTFIPPGGDFVGLWMVGKLVMQGQVHMVYDLPAFYQWQQDLFGANVELRPFPYPPFFIALLPVFTLIPYGLAFAAWFALTFGLLVWGVRMLGKKGWGTTLLLATGPAAFANIFAGQNGFLTAGLMAAGMGLLPRRPVLAGIMFGCLTFKPHLGLFIPIALLLRREWTAFAAASVTTIILWGGGALLFGPELTKTYFTEFAPSQKQVMEQWTGLLQLMIPSGFMAVRILDGSIILGYAVTVLMALAALVSVVLVWRRVENHDLRVAVLLCATVAALPYVFNYDMNLTAVAVLLLYPYMQDNWKDRAQLALLWLLPFAVLFLNALGAPLGPFILMAALSFAVRKAFYSAAA